MAVSYTHLDVYKRQSVECVIADTTIGGVAEAAMAAEKFRNSGVGVVLSCLFYTSHNLPLPHHQAEIHLLQE